MSNDARRHVRLQQYIAGFNGQRDSALNVYMRSRPYARPEEPGPWDSPDLLAGRSELVKLVLKYAPAAAIDAAMEQKRGREARPATPASIHLLAARINARRR